MSKSKEGTLILSAQVGGQVEHVVSKLEKKKPPAKQPDIQIVVNRTTVTTRAEVLQTLATITRAVENADY